MASLLMRLLTWFASGLVFKALSAFGIGIFSMYFLNQIITSLIDSMRDAVTGLPPAVLGILGLAGFDKYLSIVLGTVVTITYLRSMKFVLTREI
ncbi:MULTISPECIES: DUF2523 domain-containing protein [Acinetobacter calcoaceticus/baumannii complex]|uniref:DUF2523 domain-containing protein n=2 Tax=Acinetobacter TaxID=469 RepID=A0A7H2PW44_9GAMM|nr:MULTISPECIES: DUF2523 domain-containing protein [Acinetobacter calcoaceticus/baumannii complex]KAF1027937.1 MAG: hypothetical protein GAK29_00413 [Acinetobacter bereziniae]MDC4990247.1 DUF2523 domain-containing protein [Acinetobacter baumannii]QNX07077.1 DUF2523 domain-containing protein [Acinetobacter seifertii]QNX07089.1 DUF2523 domain-containing protein [Acinetobacter seifertii]HCA5058636.1 DUF2523 domain-containing protein [Acinetobacter baumannii]